MPDSRQKLYDAVSSKYDLGTFEEFSQKMNDGESRKKLYGQISQDFDLGTVDDFESKMGMTTSPTGDAKKKYRFPIRITIEYTGRKVGIRNPFYFK